jgi:outer membrane protein assembly factor BamB
MIEETGATNLLPLVDELTVSGDNIDTIKDAIDNSELDGDQKSDLKSFVDDTTDREDGALSDVDAFYGDIGISTDGETAYAPGYGGWIYALDVATGDTRWIVDMGDEIVGGVAVDGDVLYVGTKGESFYALSAEDGSRTWSFNADGEIWATPSIDGDAIYFTTLNGSVYRVDPEGNEEWRFSGADSGIAMRPTVSNGTVYAGSFDNRAYALNADDGSQKWEFKTDDWLWSAPVVEEDTAFFAGLDGKVYALNTEDGSARWEQPFEVNAEVRSALARGADGIVVAGRDGLVHQVDMETGEALDEPYQAGQNVEADLTTDADSNVYAVPRDPAILYVIETSGQLAATFFTLPQ